MVNDTASIHQEFGRSILRLRADALGSELAALKRRPTDKGIHDSRVQSRRLRAALEAFEDLFPPHPCKAVYDSVKEITRRLGRPREIGVTVALLRDLGGTGDMAENLCREYLVERYQAILRKQERTLRQTLRKISPRRLRSRIEFLLSGMEPQASWDAAGASAAGSVQGRRRGRRRQPQPTLFPMQESDLERARRILDYLARPILDFRPRRDASLAADEKLHALRISAKKLRYAMEIFDPVWPGSLRNQIAECRALQDTGGEYHDWCVLCAHLKADIRRLDKGKTIHLAFQIGRLLAYAEDRRAELKAQIQPALAALQTTLRLPAVEAQAEPLDKPLLHSHTLAPGSNPDGS